MSVSPVGLRWPNKEKWTPNTPSAGQIPWACPWFHLKFWFLRLLHNVYVFFSNAVWSKNQWPMMFNILYPLDIFMWKSVCKSLLNSFWNHFLILPPLFYLSGCLCVCVCVKHSRSRTRGPTVTACIIWRSYSLIIFLVQSSSSLIVSFLCFLLRAPCFTTNPSSLVNHFASSISLGIFEVIGRAEYTRLHAVSIWISH